MRKRAVYILDPRSYDLIYGQEQRARINELVSLIAPPMTAAQVAQQPSVLQEVQIILSGWGPPIMNKSFMASAPELEAVFYGAGSVRKFITDAVWERGIVVSSAAALNAVPVAEFTLAQILFSLKRGWQHAMSIRQNKEAGRLQLRVPGGYHSKVGLISLGEIGHRVCRHLSHFDLDVLAYDPYVDDADFKRLGARRVTSLEELFEECDVVSLHAPNLPETRGMITGKHFRMMRRNATFINTARGDIVRENEMVEVLRERTDLWAVLDVLANDDRTVDRQIYDLENVVITPHIAGSMDGECQRMGQAMVEELQRYLNGEPLKYQVQPQRFALMA